MKFIAFPSTNKVITKQQLIECFKNQAIWFKNFNLEKNNFDLQSYFMIKLAYVSDMAGIKFNINDEDMINNQ